MEKDNSYARTLLFNGAKILVCIVDGTYITKISKDSGLTISACNNAVHKFEKAGLVKLTPKGRKVIITLTKKGIVIQNEILKLLECIY